VSGTRVARNSALLLIAEGSRRIVSLIIAILIARSLTVADFGRFGLALALAGIFEVFASFGLSPLLTREAAADPAKGRDIYRLALGIRLWLGGLTALAMIAFSLVMDYDEATRRAIWLAAGIAWANALETASNSLFDGYQRMELTVISTIVRALVLLAAVSAAVVMGWGLAGVVGAYLFNAWFSAVYTAWLARTRLAGVTLSPRVRGQLAMLRQAAPFFMIGIVWVVAFRIDMVLLERLTDTESVGLYRSGYAFFELLLALPILATRALYPALAAGLAESRDRWHALLAAALRVYWLVALPVSIGSLLVGARLVPLFYGAKYADGGQVVALIGAFIWVWFGTMTFGWALTAADRLWDVLVGNTFAMVFNILANLMLIPPLGFFGSALATVLSELSLLVFFLYVMYTSFGGLPRRVFPWRAVPAAAALAGVTWYLRDANLGLVIAVGAAVYAALVWACRALTDEEQRVLLRLARWKRGA
jgi:O-antigen/teichoic acid export membrane protein